MEMGVRRIYRALGQPREGVEKLLGELEHEIMEIMWAREGGSVRDVLETLNAARVEDRVLAYTTVMTVMARLAEKGLLRRTRVGKAHQYEVAETREVFLARASQDIAQLLVDDFGDAAIAGFIAVLEDIAPEKLALLRRRLRPRGNA
jgi:predicted transcriptional regulator